MCNITLFSKIINKLKKQSFKRLVDKYLTDKHNKGINRNHNILKDEIVLL